MLGRSPKHAPAHARTLSMSQPSLADKVSALVKGLRMNRDVDFLSILITASHSDVVRLQIPETLRRDATDTVLLYTDSSGVVRSQSDSSAVDTFLQITADRRKVLRNFNPLGLRFPKFVRIGENGTVAVVMRKRELPMGGLDTLQRFVVPEKFIVQTRYVHWRRTKRSKMYTLANRSALKSSLSTHPSPTASPTSHQEVSYIASIRHIRYCLVSKDYRLSPETEAVLSTVLTLVEKYALSPGEQLEELVFPMVLSQDGLYLLLNVRAKVVTDVDRLPPIPRKKTRIEDFLAADHIQEKINAMTLPSLNMAEIAELSKTVYANQTYTPSALKPAATHPHVTEYLDEVVHKLDKLRTESSALKKEFGVVRKVDFSRYPEQLLDSVISKALDSILRDARLSRHFDRSHNRKKLESGIKKVFLSGTSRYLRLGLRKIHNRMGITDVDFDLFVRHFVDAMRSEEVREEELMETKLFFEDVRRDVIHGLADDDQR